MHNQMLSGLRLRQVRRIGLQLVRTRWSLQVVSGTSEPGVDAGVWTESFMAIPVLHLTAIHNGNVGPARPPWRSRSRPQTVFYVDDRGVAMGISPKLVGTPYIINELGTSIEKEITEYLWARRNGDWQGNRLPGGVVAEASGVRVKRSSLTFLRNRAYHLDDFRRWCAARGYSHISADEWVIEQYAEELECGDSEVKPQSVNQYLTSILDYLFFCSWRGWRDTLHLEHKETAVGQGKPLLFRVEDLQDIRTWYAEPDILAFIDEFELGPAKMAAEIMYGLGLRIFEVLRQTVNCFPSPEEWRRDRAMRFVKVRGKGGKLRKVPLTLKLCDSVARYKETGRRLYAGKAADRTDILILGPKRSGEYGPMTHRYLQEQFAAARVASGKSGITPHILRHHYAAHYLIRSWQGKRATVSADVKHLDLGVAGSVLSAELIILRDAMGHAWFETTCGYLKAILPLLGADLAEEYSSELEGRR